MKQTKSKKSMKQFLTLMLAFVMVFTGMGIGSWGVDEAWAAETENINLTVNGITQDGDSVNLVKKSKKVQISNQQSGMGSTFAEEIYVATVNSTQATLTNLTGTFAFHAKLSSTLNTGKFIPFLFISNNGSKTVAEIREKVEGFKVEKTALLNAGFDNTDLEANAVAYYYLHFDFRSMQGKIFGLLIQVLPSQEISKDKLKTALDKVKLKDFNKEYYTSDDRFNGKGANKDGFYSEIQSIIDKAQKVYDDSVANQAEVDKAATTLDQSNPNSELSKAIANLIPKSQLNATNLYEMIQECKKNYPDDFLEFFTQATAKNFKAALADAEKYLALLFNEEATEKNPNGANQTENVYGNQGKADGYAEALNTAMRGLVHVDDLENAQTNATTIQALAKRFSMTENNGEYTDESWKAFASAREEALTYAAAHPVTKDSTRSELGGYEKIAKTFYQAAYGLTSNTEDDSISVSLVFTDDYLLRDPSIKYNYSEVSPGTKTYTLTKEEGYTIAALFKKAGINRSSFTDGNPFGTQLAVLINDEEVDVSVTYLASNEDVICLKDGDVVHFIRRQGALYEPVYGLEPAPRSLTIDYLGALRFAETGTQVAKAGEAFTLHVERTSAHLWRYTGTYEAFEGAELAAYGPQKEDGSYPEKPIWTGSLSDVSGKASLKLYETGTYLLTAFDPRENDNEEHIYPSLNAAAPYLTVCVEEAEDSSAVKAELKKEMDKIYNDCIRLDPEYKTENPGYYSDENAAAIEKAYHNALAVLNDKESTAADSYKAQQ